MYGEILNCFLEAEEYQNKIVHISESDIFYEAKDVEKKLKSNAENSEKSKGAIARAYDKMITLLKQIMAAFKEFFTGKVSENEREELNRLRKRVKVDKELAKKEVEIKNFKVYEDVYDEALKKCDEEIKKEQPSESAVDDITQFLTAKLKEIEDAATPAAKRVAMKATLDVALDIANANELSAKAINEAMKRELIDLEDVRNTLGDKYADKFERKIHKYANLGIISGKLHELKISILDRKRNTLQGIIKSQVKKLLSFTNIKNGKVEDGKTVVDKKSLIKGVMKHPSAYGTVRGGYDKLGDDIKAVGSVKRTLKGGKRELEGIKKKGKSEASKFMKFVGVKK